MSFLKTAGAAAAFLAAGACATASMETCDPNAVDDVFQSSACDSFFQQRIARLEVQIADIESQVQRETEAAEAARIAARVIKAEIAAYQNQVASLQTSINQLQLQLAGLDKSTKEKQRTVDAMRKQVNEAQKVLAEAKLNAGPTQADVTKLEAVVQAKREAYQALLDIYKTPV